MRTALWLAMCMGNGLAALAVPTPGTFQTAVTAHYLAWDGRALTVAETSLDVSPTPALTLGATVRHTDGHGQSSANRYRADGWDARLAWQLVPADTGRLGVTLSADHEAGAAHLRSRDAVSSLEADPHYATTGGRLTFSVTRESLSARAETGGYAVRVNGLRLAEVGFAGGEVTFPRGRDVQVCLSATGYLDNANGRRVSSALAAAVTVHRGDRARLTLGATLFPSGIPPAGTPLSVPAAIGLQYNASAGAQLRTQPLGYVTLGGEYWW